MLRILSFSFALLFVVACKEEKAPQATSEINIRLQRDPQKISPFFFPSAVAREVFQYNFLSCADYHPETLELHPILLKEIPTPVDTIIDGEELVSFELEFKENIKWSDGAPLTNKDYAFTIKMIKHPLSKAMLWKPYFNFLNKVELNATNNRKLKVFFKRGYMLALEAAVTLNLLPQHLFDKDELLTNQSIKSFSDAVYIPEDSTEIKLFEHIYSSANQMKDIVQLGPYKITDYQTNQYYVLDKIPNHWTQNFSDNPFLKSNIDKLVFKIVPDELTAKTMAEEGTLDLVTFFTSNTFLNLRDNETFKNNWSFHTPQLMRYFYIGINNQDELLKEKEIRTALSYAVDIEDLIESIEGGLGVRTIGHFHPSKSYYNESIKPIPFDLEKGKDILSKAGWNEINKDGIREKAINDKKTPLKLELLITGSQTSKNMSLLIQANAKKIGIDIEIISKKMSLIRKEHINNFNYDLALLVAGSDANPDDPYRKWHSDNISGNKGNSIGYSNPKVDQLIEELRVLNKPADRKPKYLEIQRQMHEDQPVIFMYCPLNKILINKKFKATTTAKRPGYLANTFEI